MAILTAYSSFSSGDLDKYNSADKPKIIDAHHFQVSSSDGRIVVDMYGDFFTYLHANDTITAFAYSKEGHKVVDIKDLSIDVLNLSDMSSDADFFYGDDTFNGSAEYDALLGYAGNDTLYGNSGNDGLNGGTENDSLTGGWGRDVLLGGKGADIFDFNYLTESSAWILGRDFIIDFNYAEADKIDLHDVDANLLLSGNQDFTFIGAAKFSVAGQIRFDAASHVLYASNDADTQAEFSIQLMGVSRLQASDIIL